MCWYAFSDALKLIADKLDWLDQLARRAHKKISTMDGKNLFPSHVCVCLYVRVGIWNCSVSRANTDYVLCQYVILHNLRSAIQHYYFEPQGALVSGTYYVQYRRCSSFISLSYLLQVSPSSLQSKSKVSIILLWNNFLLLLFFSRFIRFCSIVSTTMLKVQSCSMYWWNSWLRGP